MLTGREAEQRQIDQLLQRAAAGSSGVLVLRGDPGIGKTALIDYAASRAGKLTTVAEADPLLILVDDLHWLDLPSQEALLFALRRLDRDAIACLLTMRPGTVAPAGLTCLEVTGLGSDAGERVVAAVAGIRPTLEVARRLHAETGGNPLALVELAATLTAEQLAGAEGAELPEAPLEPGAAIRQRFAARIHQLSPSARTVLMVTAAAGRCSPAEVQATAARLGAVDGSALGEAEAAGLIRLASTGLEFSHPLVRSVAYYVAVPAQRRAAHAALAETLAGRDAERSAWHLAAAATGPDDAAAAALDAAAGLAMAKGAPLAAAAAWERAAALSSAGGPKAARQAEAAQAALKGGDLDRARRLTERLPTAGSLAHRAKM